jgi:DNA-binding NtrC family response regulator
MVFIDMLKPRVLVIDDEPDFLETVVKRLQKRHVEVSGVGSGKEAVRDTDEPVGKIESALERKRVREKKDPGAGS